MSLILHLFTIFFVYLINNRSYANRPSVSFVNIKLPNDFFIYTSQYNNGGELVVLDATRAFLRKILTSVLTRELLLGICIYCTLDPSHLLIGIPGCIVIKYSIQRQQLAIYLWNKDETACVTVKYEYGYHADAQDTQPGYFMDLLQDVVDEIQKSKVSSGFCSILLIIKYKIIFCFL